MTSKDRSHQANSTEAQRRAFGLALRHAAQKVGLAGAFALSQALGELGHRYTERTCSRWLVGSHEPSRPVVLALEELTLSPPGTLACHLGWVPLDALDLDIEQAVMADSELREHDKPLIMVMIESLKIQARSDRLNENRKRF